jgi:hypothetical protein
MNYEVEVTLRLAVGQSVSHYVSVSGPTQILLFPFFCRKIALLFVLGALSDERAGL